MKFIAHTATKMTASVQASVEIFKDMAFSPCDEFNPICLGEISKDPEKDLSDEVKLILEYMGSQPDPEFHKELEVLFTIPADHPYYGGAQIRAVKTSSGNIIVEGIYDVDSEYVSIVVACDSTRGKFLEKREWFGVPLSQLFEDQSDWCLYETSGPMQLLGGDEEGYVTSKTILPWENQAEFIIRTRDNVYQSPSYNTFVDDALRAMATSDFHRVEVMFTFEDGEYGFNFGDKITNAQSQVLHHFFNSSDYDPAIRRSRIDAAKRYLHHSQIGIHLLREVV